MSLGISNIREKIIGLANLLREELEVVPEIVLYGPQDYNKRTSIVSFSIDKKISNEIVERLDRQGIVVALREIGDKKIIRVSPHFFNSEKQIQKLVVTMKNL